jgi:hypothetical protein
MACVATAFFKTAFQVERGKEYIAEGVYPVKVKTEVEIRFEPRK